MRRELMETATWLPVWLAVMEDNAPMISVFPTVKLQCVRQCMWCAASFPLFTASVCVFVCYGSYHSVSQGLNLCVFACVTELVRMVCPSPIKKDNKRQPWSLREISTIREKHRELGWLRGTRSTKLSEEFCISGELETEWMTSHLWETDELVSYSWESLHRGRSYFLHTGRANPP